MAVFAPPPAIPPCTVDLRDAGYAVEFSPYRPDQIAVAVSQYFGIVGAGRQMVFERVPGTAEMRLVRAFDTPDGVYDCAWSETNPNQVVSASGDGSVALFDVTAAENRPVARWQEHETEVASVDWNCVRKDSFLSASWDNTIKLFTPQAPRSLMTFAEHTYCVYQAVWSPRRANVFASASGDGTVRIWDANVAPRSIQRIAPAHGGEVLTVDWNKYNDNMLVTGKFLCFVCPFFRPEPPGPSFIH
jgi:peroxin-7